MKDYLTVYILKCSDNSYYTGVTNNLERRIEEHNHGIDKTCFTYSRRPLKLVFYQEFKNAIDAISCEKQIKGWCRAKKEALIQNDFEKLHELAKCKNKTNYLLNNFEK